MKKNVRIFVVAFLFPFLANAQHFDSPQENPFGLYDMSAQVLDFVDLDNDGDFDLMTIDGPGEFQYFINNGTKTSPTFGTPQENPFGLYDMSAQVLDFVDLDNDGDFDLMTIDGPGEFQYFINNGTKTSPTFGAPQENPFGLYDMSAQVLDFVDLDNDGDFDLMTIDGPGEFQYFINSGTKTSPTFGAPQENPFGLYDMSAQVLDFVDLDNDGDFDLMTIDGPGEFQYFINNGTKTSPTFGAPQENPFGLYDMSAQVLDFVDLDNDGDFDLMTIDGPGEFQYFKNSSSNSIFEINEQISVILYPNPSNGKFAVETNNCKINAVEINNELGDLIYRITEKDLNYLSIDLSSFAKGMYFITIVSQEKVFKSNLILR